MTDQGPPNLKSRFAGVLLGTMVGDQLGTPFEGQSPEVVADLRMNSGLDAAFLEGLGATSIRERSLGRLSSIVTVHR